MRPLSRRLALAILFAIVGDTLNAADPPKAPTAPGIYDLETPSGLVSKASALSGDGSIVVGYVGDEAAYWEWDAANSKFVHKPVKVAGRNLIGEVTGVSENGEAFAGFDREKANSPRRAFVFEKASSAITYLVGVGSPPPTTTADFILESFAGGMSDNGQAVAGSMQVIDPGIHGQFALPFYWVLTKPRIVEGLGDLPGGHLFARASHISNDGTVVVGSGESARNAIEPVKWDAGNHEAVPLLAGHRGAALSVSNDGKVIVGFAVFPDNKQHGFAWKQGAGTTRLKPAAPNEEATGNGVTADGKDAVGLQGVRALESYSACIWRLNGNEPIADSVWDKLGKPDKWDLIGASAVRRAPDNPKDVLVVGWGTYDRQHTSYLARFEYP